MLSGLVCIVACALGATSIVSRDDAKVAGRTTQTRTAKSIPFTLPAGSLRLEQARRQGSTTLLNVVRRERSTTVRDDWTVGAVLPEVTSDAGGSYAVRDTFSRDPKPRRRGSPLAAAFVLRLDGQDESPAFSVGGGGVAEAVWSVMPR